MQLDTSVVQKVLNIVEELDLHRQGILLLCAVDQFRYGVTAKKLIEYNSLGQKVTINNLGKLTREGYLDKSKGNEVAYTLSKKGRSFINELILNLNNYE